MRKLDGQLSSLAIGSASLGMNVLAKVRLILDSSLHSCGLAFAGFSLDYDSIASGSY